MNGTSPAKNFPPALMKKAQEHIDGIVDMAVIAGNMLEGIDSLLNDKEEEGDKAEMLRSSFGVIAELAKSINTHSQAFEKLLDDLHDESSCQKKAAGTA